MFEIYQRDNKQWVNLSAYYPFDIFQTFITSGYCVVDLLTVNYPFGIFKHLLLVDIVLH
jgi:hypothetical protein